jgi:hypothetical protein
VLRDGTAHAEGAAMKRHAYYLALGLSLLASGCGLIKIKTKGFGTGTNGAPEKTEKSSEQARSGDVAKGQRGPSNKRSGGSHERDNDDAFAMKMVDHLVGRAHELTGFEDDEYQLPVGKGKFSFDTKKEWLRMENRLVYIAEQAHPGKKRRVIIQREACIQEMLNGKDESINRKKADYRCKTRTARKWYVFNSGEDIYLRGVFLEHALEGVSKKVKKKAVKRFVESLGDEVVEFRVAVPDNDYGVKAYVLKDVPMQKWPQTTLRYALRFAKKHGASAKLIAKVKAAQAKAPTHKCITRTLVVARDHEGGGRYSGVYLDQKAHAAAKFSERGDIDCAKVRRKPSDSSLLRVLKRDHDEPKTILRAHYRKGSVWDVYYNRFDIPTVKRRNIQVYFRVET